eukprot:scaffold132746_cov31-Tisochrysis_lutea.AAC.4
MSHGTGPIQDLAVVPGDKANTAHDKHVDISSVGGSSKTWSHGSRWAVSLTTAFLFTTPIVH